jgi:hypothetical protein
MMLATIEAAISSVDSLWTKISFGFFCLTIIMLIPIVKFVSNVSAAIYRDTVEYDLLAMTP